MRHGLDKKERNQREKRDSAKTTWIIGGVVLGVAALGGLAAVLLLSGEAKADDAQPDKKPADNKPADDKPADNKPVDEPADDNWGVTPPELRAEFERAEEASGIPNLGRFMAVWAWGAFRAKKPFVSTEEAAAISAANPWWCRDCHNQNAEERKKSKDALDRVTKPKSEGGAYDPPWPMPDDAAGWSDGSAALFDVLLGAQVHAGIHEGFTPLVKQPASVVFRIDVQLYLGGWIVYRIVHRDDLKVLVAGDSAATWSNIRACTATPEGFKEMLAGKQTPLAKAAAEAKANCLGRAAELGINLAKVPPPLPGWSWPGAKVYWERLGVLSKPEVQKQKQADVQEVGGFSVRRIAATKPGSPVVWMLHGLGGDVDQLLPQASELSLEGVDAEMILLSRGSSWIKNPDGSPDQVALQLSQVAGDLVAMRTTLNGQALRPWLVFGYSQGGAVAYQIAAKNLPATVVVAAARLPKPPALPMKPATRIVAIQGGDDKTVPPAEAEATAEIFAKAGFPVVWDLHPKVGHSLATLGAPIVEVLANEVEKIAKPAIDPFPAGTKSVQLPAGLFARVIEPPGLPAGAPLVVVLHGETTNEAQLLGLRQAVLASEVRMAFLRSPRGDARWMPAGGDAKAFADALAAAAVTVTTGINQLRAQYFTQQVVIAGYSEGAAVALQLAAQGNGTAALSIAGFLPQTLGPKGPVPTWVSMVFGGSDPTITPALSKQTAALFVGKASQVTQQEVAAATHDLATLITPAVAALDEILQEVT